MKLGDALFLLGCWLWMTISVGPWYVGVLIFVIGYLGNMYHAHLLVCPTCRSALFNVLSMMKKKNKNRGTNL